MERDAWERLVPLDDPFSSWDFLDLLERSGSVGEQSGWRPCYITLGEPLESAIIAYERDDSWGEYIFDFAWADAAQRAGIPYYPKLTSTIPFTPVTTSRVLGRLSENSLTAMLSAVATTLTQRSLSSAHLLYLNAAEWQMANEVADGELPFHPRMSIQFQWRNRGYETFDDFLAELRSEPRKQVRKESQRAKAAFPISVEHGSDLTRKDLSDLYELYRYGCLSHGSTPYLTKAFFELMNESPVRKNLVVVTVRDSQGIAAASINFRRGQNLFGRYWGTRIDAPLLHFECCYYQLIDFAIKEKITKVEAGAQGYHKLKRGFEPTPIYSLHSFAEPQLSKAVGSFLRHERKNVEEQIEALALTGPYRTQSATVSALRD